MRLQILTGAHRSGLTRRDGPAAPGWSASPRLPGWRRSLALARLRGSRGAAGKRAVLAGVAGAAVLAAGCGGSASSPGGSAGGPRVIIQAKQIAGLGTVLVSSSGYVLYMFAPDNRRVVSCTALCAATWPPVRLPAGATPVAGPGVRQSLLGSDPDPAGGRPVLTYNGWPLYGYTADVTPGQYTGEGIDLNGGLWYALRPSGEPLRRQVR